MNTVRSARFARSTRSTRFILCLLAVVGFAACYRNTTPPEQAATQFLKDLNIEYVGKPSCAGVDTDNDGYVTCTVRLAKADASGKDLVSLQCADITSYGCDAHTSKYAVGCKETMVAMTVQAAP